MKENIIESIKQNKEEIKRLQEEQSKLYNKLITTSKFKINDKVIIVKDNHEKYNPNKMVGKTGIIRNIEISPTTYDYKFHFRPEGEETLWVFNEDEIALNS